MKASPRSLAVVGAGWLGHEVARRAVGAGTRVIATTRSGEWRGDPVEGASLSAFDVVADPDEALASILEGIDVAVFCYAPSRDQDRETLYVEGARRAARVCRGLEIARVIWTSSTSALPAIDGWVDETSEIWPDAPRGRVQREAEKAISEGLDGVVPWTILRLAGLYGPGRELGRLYRVGDDPVKPGDGLECTNLVHLDDAAGAVLAATKLPPEHSSVIHVCDDDHRTRREVAAEVARRTGRPAPQWAEEAAGRSPRGKLVSNARMKSDLKLALRHPTHD